MEKIPFMIIAQAETLSATAIYWMVLERVFALGAQIVLSYYVLYAVADRNIRCYFYAILLHAMLDSPTALVQAGILAKGWFYVMLVFELAVLPVLFIFLTFMANPFSGKENTAAKARWRGKRNIS